MCLSRGTLFLFLRVFNGFIVVPAIRLEVNKSHHCHKAINLSKVESSVDLFFFFLIGYSSPLPSFLLVSPACIFDLFQGMLFNIFLYFQFLPEKQHILFILYTQDIITQCRLHLHWIYVPLSLLCSIFIFVIGLLALYGSCIHIDAMIRILQDDNVISKTSIEKGMYNF